MGWDSVIGKKMDEGEAILCTIRATAKRCGVRTDDVAVLETKYDDYGAEWHAVVEVGGRAMVASVNTASGKVEFSDMRV